MNMESCTTTYKP